MEQKRVEGHNRWLDVYGVCTCDARRSESKALPLAQFVNAAYDAEP